MEHVNVIVRFHDFLRLRELDRCIFCLVGQSYRPLHIVLVLQRFSEAQVVATRNALAPYLSLPRAPELTILNLEDPAPKDERAVLLNKGVQATTGRYLAFLDYDDLLYPEAYSLLMSRLRATDAAVVFASVRVVNVQVYSQFMYVSEVVKDPFGGGSCLIDLLEGNFCGSNTVSSTAVRSGYDKIAARIETRRRATYVVPGIQKAAGICIPKERITIRELIDTMRGK